MNYIISLFILYKLLVYIIHFVYHHSHRNQTNFFITGFVVLHLIFF